MGLLYKSSNSAIIGQGSMQDVQASNQQPSKSYQIGSNKLLHFQEGMEIQSPMKSGLIADLDGISSLIGHILTKEIQIDPADHPVLMTEPSFNTAAIRSKLTEIIFEQHGSPAFFLAKTPVLASFAHGKSTSVVLESGSSTTVVTPVHDGFALTRSVVKQSLAGDELTNILEQSIRSSGAVELTPMFMLAKRQIVEGLVSVSKRDIRPTTSFLNYHVHQLVQDIKESTCKVSEVPFNTGSGSSEVQMQGDQPSSGNNIPNNNSNTTSEITYSMPDNSTYNPGTSRFLIPEIMFKPELVPPSYHNAQSIATSLSVHHMIQKSISMVDSDIKRDLYQNIFITGGNTLFQGFAERVISELSPLAGPSFKLKNQSLPNNMERKNASFIGASILGSLGTFHQMWISKQEYTENGRGIVDRKCP